MYWEWTCIVGLIIISVFIIYIFARKKELNKKCKIIFISLVLAISVTLSYYLVSSSNTEIINSDIAIFFTYYPNEKIDECISNVKIKDVDIFFSDEKTEVRYHLIMDRIVNEPSIVTGGCIQLPINEIISNGILSLDFNKKNHESLKIDKVEVFLLNYKEKDKLDSFKYGTPLESFTPKGIENEQCFREYKYYHLSSLQDENHPEFYLILQLNSVYPKFPKKIIKNNMAINTELIGNFIIESNFVRLNFLPSTKIEAFHPSAEIGLNPYRKDMKSLEFSDSTGGFIGIILLNIFDTKLFIALIAITISIFFIIISFLRNKE